MLFALYVGIISLIAAPFVAILTGASFTEALYGCARAVGLGVSSVPFSALVILLWVRWLELRDSSQDAPPVNKSLLREMAEREDRVVQNHMASVVLIKPGILRAVLIRAGLSDLLEHLRTKEDTPRAGSPKYGRLESGIPALHFMSMTEFQDGQYDPIFVLEANFDGAPGPFWAQLEATLEPGLRPILRCCKRPADSTREMYDALTEPGSRYPIAPYLEAKTFYPAVFHQGNRGLDRDRILRDGELFQATRTELARSGTNGLNPYRGQDAQNLHKSLRAAVLPHFPWLNAPCPSRIAPAERVADLLRLVGFLFLALFLLSMPGVVIAPITPTLRFGIAVAMATCAAAVLVFRMRQPLKDQDVPTTSGGLVPSRRNKLTSLAYPLTLLIAIP